MSCNGRESCLYFCVGLAGIKRHWRCILVTEPIYAGIGILATKRKNTK